MMGTSTRILGIVLLLAATLTLATSAARSAVSIETVHVANPGNADDTRHETPGYGGVAYEYNIGKYEVTAGQYCAFLNDVDPDGYDAHGLYSPLMNTDHRGCQITWNASTSGYDFSGGTVEAPASTAADWANRPVNFVSWYDAAMFCNWLTSGNVNQGAYDTSSSANWNASNASLYAGITARHSAAMDTLVSQYGTVYLIPTEDEWYKAAYHDKTAGTAGTYFDYPTSSDSAPGNVNDSGNLSGTGDPFIEGDTDPGNYATYDGDFGTHGIGSPYWRTEVGEWENSGSPYGTFDQGGNVWEWNEAVIAGAYRAARGGSFNGGWGFLHAEVRVIPDPPAEERSYLGFRVVQVPEPATLAVLAAGGAGFLLRRRRGRNS